MILTHGSSAINVHLKNRHHTRFVDFTFRLFQDKIAPRVELGCFSKSETLNTT